MRIKKIVLVMTLILGGCGYQSANLTRSGEGINFEQTAVGILPPETSESLSKAYVRMKEADLKRLMYETLERGAYSGYALAFINNDKRQKAYIYHPELPTEKIVARPGGEIRFFVVSQMPKDVIVYASSGRILGKAQIKKQYEENRGKYPVGGVKVDFYIRVDKI